MAIDRTARIHRKAELASDVDVGAFTVIGPGVRIREGTSIGNSVTIVGYTDIGRNNTVYHNVVIGTLAQSLHRDKEPTRVIIGDGNVIREFVTVSAGTMAGGGVTIVGNENYLMACSHVAHDCVLEDNIIMANSALLAGHVKVERFVNISGNVVVHQFVTIGEMSMLGGLTGVPQDVPPYMVVLGAIAWPRSVNVIGLRRRGMSEETIAALEDAFRLIYRSRLSRRQALDEIESRYKKTPEIRHLIGFLRRTERRIKGRFLESTRD
jgi:UDP-N-acetylglucosamine acyltransferase